MVTEMLDYDLSKWQSHQCWLIMNKILLNILTYIFSRIFLNHIIKWISKLYFSGVKESHTQYKWWIAGMEMKLIATLSYAYLQETALPAEFHQCN